MFDNQNVIQYNGLKYKKVMQRIYSCVSDCSAIYLQARQALNLYKKLEAKLVLGFFLLVMVDKMIKTVNVNLILNYNAFIDE